MVSGRESHASAIAGESELVERVRTGETEAFGELVRRYQRRAYAIAYRLLRQQQDAEDLVQDAFMTALDKLDSFDVRRPFGPWFFRILVNRGTSQLRARNVRATEEIAESIGDTAPSPARLVEQAEIGERVRAAMADLSERQRLVVQLLEIDGFTTAEVAEMLEIAEPTVRWTLHEARKRLRAGLETWRKARDDG
ncbi:MAG TPA: sigma-70 family RNA polymerase sigma factor [Gemmatimonadales bacterium]|nr:sigma-70 family RNA polymerase sigma factor [Gemmatimonadales bacterium]